jgi:hypothetical protein
MIKQKTKLPQFSILTVVSMAKNSFGLQDYNYPFSCEDLSITLTNKIIKLNNSIVAYNRNGRLTNPEINDWIQLNELYKFDKPIKLIFKLERRLHKYHYRLYSYQANHLNKI